MGSLEFHPMNSFLFSSLSQVVSGSKYSSKASASISEVRLSVSTIIILRHDLEAPGDMISLPRKLEKFRQYPFTTHANFCPASLDPYIEHS